MQVIKKSQLGKYRHQLQKAREQIVTIIQRVASDGRDEKLWGETNDSGDLALGSYTKEFLYKLSDVERSQFVEIDAALQRIDEGSYGKCVDCGTPLPDKRLAVVPWASRCTPCQELFERSQEEKAEAEAELANM